MSVLILNVMLLLPDRDNWVPKWTKTKVVRQCRVMVFVVSFLSCFTPLSVAKKYIALVSTNFVSSTLRYWWAGKGFKECISQYFKSNSQSLGEWLKSGQSRKVFKKLRNTSLLISLHSGQKWKTSLLSKKEINQEKQLLDRKMDFFSYTEMTHLPHKEFCPTVTSSLNLLNAESVDAGVIHG